MAIPPLDDFVTEQQRETQHWLNSTSTYYNIDWINKEKASKHYISRRNTSRVIIWAKTLAVSQRKFAKSEALVTEPFGMTLKSVVVALTVQNRRN